MRKLVLAFLVTASALAAAPAMADNYGPTYGQTRNWDRDRDGRNDRQEDRAYDQRFDRDRDGRNDRLEDRAYDQQTDGYGYGNGEETYSPRRYQGWYPGWRHSWYENRPLLSPHRLIRRVERQGFYGARPMGFSRRGMVRVMAYDQWRRPVVLRVDPYSGRVLHVRPV